MSYLLQDGNGWDHTKVVLFQTISRYSEEKYVWRSAYSILVLVRRNIGVLFYFNLTCDVMQDYIPKFLVAWTGCQEQAVENLDFDGAIRAAWLSFPLRSHRKGEESLLHYPFLCSN